MGLYIWIELKLLGGLKEWDILFELILDYFIVVRLMILFV